MSSNLPQGRVPRLVQTAKVGAVVSAGALLNGKSEAAIGRAADVLAELRGLPAKAGQLGGYVWGLAPRHQGRAYRAAMGRLTTATKASRASDVRRLVEAELGRSIEEAFAQWEAEPFASASIGQVHRARLHDGTRVAVKVQHPGIEEALEADLGNARALDALIARLVPAGTCARELWTEAAGRFREELDYEKEARNLDEFRELHRDDPTMRMPRCVHGHSTRRVLTTVFHGGDPFHAAVRHAVGLRESHAETLWRFVTRSILHGGAFNADPHPGNYLFNKDGRVVLLDFGCVQRLSEERRMLAGALRLAAVRRDESAFRAAVRDWFRARRGAGEAGAQRFMRLCFEPIFASPFRFTREYVASVVRGVGEFRELLLSRDASAITFPVETVLLNRLQFGLYSILAELDVQVDYAVLDGDVIMERALGG